MTEERATSALSSLLNARETVLQALQRLGSKRKKTRGTKRKQASQQPKDNTPAQTAEEKAQFEQITEAADFLMRRGEVDVYSQIKEEFMSEEEVLAQRRGSSNSSAATAGRVTFAAEMHAEEGKSEERPPEQEILWEYRGADGQIHGPFPSSSFIAWQQQGYFTGDSAVDIRQIGEKDGERSGKEEEEAAPKSAPEKISAEQELLNDFEDSEDDAEEKATEEPLPKAEEKHPWKRSDQIDFSSY